MLGRVRLVYGCFIVSRLVVIDKFMVEKGFEDIDLFYGIYEKIFIL